MNQEHPLSLVIKVMKPSVPMHELAALLATATKNSEDENRRIYADAASGVGPQPWERDWPLGEFDLVDHLTSAEFNADDLVLSHLLMMVQWALDSHLGRQALMADGLSNNPGQNTLDTLREFRSGLVLRRRELLACGLENDSDSWAYRCPLGDFNLFEHIATCDDFRPDWFATGELIEIADWALSSWNAQGVDRRYPLDWQKKKPVLDVIHQFGEALGVRRRRLLMEQAQSSLGYSKESLVALASCLDF